MQNRSSPLESPGSKLPEFPPSERGGGSNGDHGSGSGDASEAKPRLRRRTSFAGQQLLHDNPTRHHFKKRKKSDRLAIIPDDLKVRVRNRKFSGHWVGKVDLLK